MQDMLVFVFMMVAVFRFQLQDRNTKDTLKFIQNLANYIVFSRLGADLFIFQM